MNTFTTTPVRFDRDTVELVSNLYVPDRPGPHPAVVVTGTWPSVKEQMANRYASTWPPAATSRSRLTSPTSATAGEESRTSSRRP